MRIQTATIITAALLLAFASASAQEQRRPQVRNCRPARPRAATHPPAALRGKSAPADDPLFRAGTHATNWNLEIRFDVNFDLSPEFNQTVTVQPDGYITLRGIGDVHVADLTVPELTAHTAHRLQQHSQRSADQHDSEGF